MPRAKVLVGVSRDIGHSFTSLMNYAGDDYVMGHLLRHARATGYEALTIDFVQREAHPAELLAPPISNVPAWYIEKFWELVLAYGADASLVRSATLVLRYDIATTRRNPAGFIESPYTCDVLITDTAGKTYPAHYSGWWYPEV